MIDAVPEFESLIVCVASLPTVTLPKLTEEGVMASADELPDPVQSAVIAALDTLLVTEIAPDSVEVEAGLNVAVRLALSPALSVAGALIPEIVIPLPEAVIFEIVADAWPVFFSVTVWDAVVPSATLPKLIVVGEIATAPSIPCPFRGMVVVASVALLAIVTAPVAAPLAAAVNDTPKVAVFPVASVIGAVSPLVLKPVPETLIFEMSSVSEPEFVITTLSEVPAPTTTCPKLSDVGETETAIVPVAGFVPPPPAAPFPVVPTQPEVINIAASVSVPNALRITVDVERSPGISVLPVPTSRVVRASLITEAIVACATVDALLARGTQLGQVCATGQWDRPVRTASLAVRTCR